MKSLELLPTLVSRMEAALGDVTSGPLLKAKKDLSERTKEELSEFRYATYISFKRIYHSSLQRVLISNSSFILLQ
jgi:hypothetical protein